MAEVTPFLSVIVTSHNQLRSIQRLIGQLIEQDFPPDNREIVVVDDASNDGSSEWLQRQEPGIVAILNSRNLSRARSRNLAVSRAKGTILVMIDGDHMVQRDFLTTHAQCHRQGECVIVGKSTYVEHPDFVAMHHYLNNCGAEKVPPGESLPGRYFITRNCSLPRDLYIRHEGLDEQFTNWGGEDLDLGVRLAKAGTPIYYEPAAFAQHDHLRPLDEMLQQLREFGNSGVPILLSKHSELLQELNLDHVTTLDTSSGRFGTIHRCCFRLLMTSPIFVAIRGLVNMFRRRKLPRFLFDYLHLRQYGLGFLASRQFRKDA